MAGRRIVAVVLLAAGALALSGAAAAVLWPLAQGSPPPVAGELWYKLDPGSLNLIQAVIERYVSQPLWQEALFPILLEPAWLVLGALGLALLAVGWLVRGRR
jgi:hypothetical protein